MVNSILVGVDGSAKSLEAARYAMGLAEQTKAKLTFVFVIEPPQIIPFGPMEGFVTAGPSKSTEDVTRAEKIVETLAKERPALNIATRVELGDAADVIVESAAKLGVDLIVVGARGQNVAQRVLLGSVSDRVVHHAPCPVTVVRR